MLRNRLLINFFVLSVVIGAPAFAQTQGGNENTQLILGIAEDTGKQITYGGEGSAITIAGGGAVYVKCFVYPTIKDVVLRIVHDVTGLEPREIRFVRTDDGTIAYLTLGLDAASPLAEAHARASEIEERIRRARPDIADVIVHTEP